LNFELLPSRKKRKGKNMDYGFHFLTFLNLLLLLSHHLFSSFFMFVCRAVVTVEFGFGEMSTLNLGWHCKSFGSQTALRCGAYPAFSHQANALAFRGSESMGHALKIPFGNKSGRRRLMNHIHPPLRVRSFLHYRVLCSFLLFI
jgi:hypothetical protein